MIAALREEVPLSAKLGLPLLSASALDASTMGPGLDQAKVFVAGIAG